MPALLKAQQQLDAAVDSTYGRLDCRNDAWRVAFLFGLCQEYTSPLPAEGTAVAKRKSGKNRPA